MESIRQICSPGSIPCFSELKVYNGNWLGRIKARVNDWDVSLLCEARNGETIIHDVNTDGTIIYKTDGVLDPEAVLLLIDNLLTRSVK